MRIREVNSQPELSKKWIFRHREWAVIYSQLMIYFGERLVEQA